MPFRRTSARGRLVEDLGVEPGPELRDIERAVLSGDPLLLGTPIQTTPLPDSLPGGGTVCVGRDEELAWLCAALDAAACDAGQARLVVASVGLGKTQHVVELARRAAERGIVCRYGRGSAALDALVIDPTRLSLVLVDALGTRRGVARRHVGRVLDIAWSPDGRTFASTAEDRLTIQWDAASLRPREVLEGAPGRQLKVRYSPDGQTLFTSGQDGGLYAWDLSRQRGLEVELHPAGFYSGSTNAANAGPVAFDFPRDRVLVFESKTVHTVDLGTAKADRPAIHAQP